jgi:hypothetical protein
MKFLLVGSPHVRCNMHANVLRCNFQVLLEILIQRADRGRQKSIPRDSNVTAERPKGADDNHRVVPFRPRIRGVSGGPRPAGSAVEGLAKYEGGEEQEGTYRHRMMVNLAALAFTIALALAGVWLAIQIADLRKNQDCVLSGRRDCAPIDVNARERK